MAKTLFFTITGTQFRFGSDFMKIGKKAKGKVFAVLPDGVLCTVDVE